MTQAPAPDALARRVRRAGLLAGPVAAAACYAWLPAEYLDAAGAAREFSHAGRAALAMMVWMAVWWLSDALPLAATALLPIACFPLLGVATLARTSAPYGSDIIFLFLGGFILAGAIQRWGLDRRIAFLALRLVGTRPNAMVGGVMAATAFLSMWVSNTATAAMMVPIALALAGLVRERGRADAAAGTGAGAHEAAQQRFASGLVLAIAYAASIGGIGTIVGSPPNGIVVRFIAQSYGREVSFAEWMMIGMPLVLVFLPLAWWLMTRVWFRSGLTEIPGGRAWVAGELRRLGALSRGERVTLAVFALTVLLWIFRPLLALVEAGGIRPLAGLSDSGIAVLAALALFALPAGGGQRAADWTVARQVPWDVLILFGGGLSLAAAIEHNGVAEYLGSLARGMAGWPAPLVVLAVVALTTFLSELTSNTAQVAIMVPLLAAFAPAVDVDPYLLIVPCTLAASAAFMMPVGTPPNAIVFGTGLVTMREMCRAGFWLNLLGILLITVLAYAVILPAFVPG